MKIQILLFILFLQFCFAPICSAESPTEEAPAGLPVTALLGEKLEYRVSFLWFKKIARGEIRLEAGPETGTYLATLKAATLGVAAFFTRNRVETYTTLMEEGPDGLLRPLLQTSDTRKERAGQETHRQTSYAFDFGARQVNYSKTVNGTLKLSQGLEMDGSAPVYDFLSAFYNLRLGRFGTINSDTVIKLSTFSRKGPNEIEIYGMTQKQQVAMDFAQDLLLCKVLLSPETFKMKGRDVYVGFDQLLRPQIAVVKNVIGLGDVRGELIRATTPGQLH